MPLVNASFTVDAVFNVNVNVVPTGAFFLGSRWAVAMLASFPPSRQVLCASWIAPSDGGGGGAGLTVYVAVVVAVAPSLVVAVTVNVCDPGVLVEIRVPLGT